LPANAGNAAGNVRGAAAANARPTDADSIMEAQRLQATFGSGWYEPLKSLLAIIGLSAIALRLVKAVR
jgi:hypothetical protein